MGVHSSLRKSGKSSAVRSVMSRTERIKLMSERGSWGESGKVLGLPKIKTLKIKAVKKAAKTPEEKKDAPAGAKSAAAKPAAAKAAAPKK
jgi:small basic protein (TIGR04137 family)